MPALISNFPQTSYGNTMVVKREREPARLLQKEAGESSRISALAGISYPITPLLPPFAAVLHSKVAYVHPIAAIVHLIAANIPPIAAIIHPIVAIVHPIVAITYPIAELEYYLPAIAPSIANSQ